MTRGAGGLRHDAGLRLLSTRPRCACRGGGRLESGTFRSAVNLLRNLSQRRILAAGKHTRNRRHGRAAPVQPAGPGGAGAGGRCRRRRPAGRRADHGPGRPGRLSALSVSHSKPVFYGAFVWARRALNSQKWRLLARTGGGGSRVGRLRRGPSVILPPFLSFVQRIPMRSTHCSAE